MSTVTLSSSRVSCMQLLKQRLEWQVQIEKLYCKAQSKGGSVQELSHETEVHYQCWKHDSWDNWHVGVLGGGLWAAAYGCQGVAVAVVEVYIWSSRCSQTPLDMSLSPLSAKSVLMSVEWWVSELRTVAAHSSGRRVSQSWQLKSTCMYLGSRIKDMRLIHASVDGLVSKNLNWWIW